MRFDGHLTEIRLALAAFLALTRKAWLMGTRYPMFWGDLIFRALLFVLPTMLAIRALAGPSGDQIAQFSTTAGTPNYLGYTTVGLAGWTWWNFLAVSVGLALTAERTAGTLFLTWLSPAPQAFLIFGHAAAMGIKFAILVAAMVLLSWAIFQFPLALEMLPLLLVLVMGLAAGAAFGLIVAAVVVRHRHSALLTNSLIGALAFMVGISYPVDVLPIWIQKLALIVPATWVVRGARASLVFGDSSDALISAVVLLVSTLAYGAVGIWLFGKLTRSARISGVLEAY